MYKQDKSSWFFLPYHSVIVYAGNVPVMTTFFGGSWQPHLFILPVDYLNKTLKGNHGKYFKYSFIANVILFLIAGFIFL